MEWINSYGGPLICLEVANQDSWGGNDWLSVTYAGAKTDYDRACESNDYTSVIPLVDGQALVFSMGALETSVWRDLTGVPYVVQIEYSEPYIDEGKLLKTMQKDIFAHPQRTSYISFSSSSLMIFDSADSGSDKTNKWLPVMLNVGLYRVITQGFKPNTETSFILHRFELLSKA